MQSGTITSWHRSKNSSRVSGLVSPRKQCTNAVCCDKHKALDSNDGSGAGSVDVRGIDVGYGEWRWRGKVYIFEPVLSDRAPSSLP